MPQQSIDYLFQITKYEPYRNNIVIPSTLDLKKLPWKKIIVQYKPEMPKSRFGNMVIQSESVEPYEILVYAFPHNGALVLKPIDLEYKAEFEDIFGKHRSLQQLLTTTRKFPIVKIDTKNVLIPLEPIQQGAPRQRSKSQQQRKPTQGG